MTAPLSSHTDFILLLQQTWTGEFFSFQMTFFQKFKTFSKSILGGRGSWTIWLGLGSGKRCSTLQIMLNGDQVPKSWLSVTSFCEWTPILVAKEGVCCCYEKETNSTDIE
jgi:hypothetical protein